MDQNQNSSINGADYTKNEMLNNLMMLLAEHSQRICLTDLEVMYKTKFSKSLLSELIKMALPDIANRIAFTSIQHQDNGSLDNGIELKHQEENIDQERDQLLQEVTEPGIVSADFSYDQNPFMAAKGETFMAFVSSIDRRHQLIYIQPEYYTEYLAQLTEQLDFYYSNSISNDLIVKEVATGLACVCKYEGVWHRVLIKKNLVTTYVVLYIDLGITEEVKKTDIQFKHLLAYFSKLPRIAVPCRLVDIDWKLENYEMSSEVYKELNALCQGGPFYVEHDGERTGVLNVKIYDADGQCLNDVVVNKGLASFSSSQLDVPMPSTPNTKNGHNNQQHQRSWSTAHSKQQLSENYQENHDIPTTQNVKLACLMNDYEDDVPVPQKPVTKNSPRGNANNGYMNENVAPMSNPSNKSGTPQDRRKPANGGSPNLKSQNNQRDLQTYKNQQLKVTIGQNTSRLFDSAWSSVLRNGPSTQRQAPNSVVPTSRPKEDSFASWMCSWSTEQSLWLSEEHRNALLKYIGRIYKQEAHIHRLYLQLKKETGNLDELDLLHTLIKNTKERHTAQTSFGKWKDSSRIERRAQDLQFIFEYDGNSSSSNHRFKVAPSGLKRIIDRQRIKSYFDLGCGDGVITAGIGQYLGLTKENIFGGDVFDGQCKDITFVPINEKESTIRISSNSIDLATAFVTFHHISQITDTLKELARILRPGGYLIIREHDCRNDGSLSAKYLNFVHAIMMIAGVGEFANSSTSDYIDDTNNWPKQKSYILEYAKTISYRAANEWKQHFESVGFRFCATLHYGNVDGSGNPQKLFYGVYQLNTK